MRKEVQVRSDLDLVKLFRKGDQQAFEELIGRYSTKAFHLALRLTRNQHDAEEVLQDVFSTVHRKIKYFEGRSQFSSWLYRITVNACFMRLRKRKSRDMVSIEDIAPVVRNKWSDKASERESGDNITYRNHLRLALEKAVDLLPEDYRPVFILRDIDGLSNREVGTILRLSIPAVKSRLHRARIMLRSSLLPYFNELEAATEMAATSPDQAEMAEAV